AGQGARFDGIVFDLGLSSAQLKDQNRGFSFQVDASRLDMAFGLPPDKKAEDGRGGADGTEDEREEEAEKSLSTKDIVNNWPKEELARIFKEYGEERFAWRIAEKIVEIRKKIKKSGGEGIATVGELVNIIKSAVPAFYRNGRINPATKIFQALRVATNDELGSLIEVLPQAVEALKPGGRLVVISYHSLEDRIVKNFFKKEAFKKSEPGKGKLKILTKKVIIPRFEEAKENPRSRSAKLRAAERI
ncbi:MAG: 16S rRNA (cytosine(1402)-N(4))-methyltransferase RsmH, partial [Patescibacteria group bacterium]